MNLSIPDISYKWNHTIISFCFWLYFLKNNVYKVLPCCSMYQNNLFLYMAGKCPNLSIHPSGAGRFGCFHFLAIVNSAAVDMSVHVLVWVPVFNSSGYIPWSRILGLYGNICLAYKRLPKLFSIATAPFHIPISKYKDSISLYLCQHLLFFGLFVLITAILVSVKWHFIVVFICISLMLMMLNILSCTCWLCICLLWSSVCPGPLFV